MRIVCYFGSALRFLAAFGRFWWDFLVGDTPELFVGVCLVVGLVAFLAVHHVSRTVLEVLPPVCVVGLLGYSVRRAAHR